MVRTRFNQGLPRRGIALLWDSKILSGLNAHAAVSLRQFFAIVDDWPEELPAAGGDALVVAGFEGCLDLLSAEDAMTWIETDLKESALSFQDFYQGSAGLIFWLPSGSNRVRMNASTEEYFWKHREFGKEGLPLGQALFAGAQAGIERLLNIDDPKADFDGIHWAGLHHPRIS